MPRSEYCWIVQHHSGEIANAFTVKHELASWIEGREHSYHVFRLRAGALKPEIVEFNPRTLEPVL